jgi:hypothetical protein
MSWKAHIQDPLKCESFDLFFTAGSEVAALAHLNLYARAGTLVSVKQF